jgi:hypothetical protein
LNITQNRFKQAEFVRNVFHVVPEHGAEPDDLLKPEYWTHIARNFKAGSLIEAVPEDNAWRAEYYVLSAGTDWAKVARISFTQFDKTGSVPAEKEAKHVVNYGGAIQKWRIVRVADGVTLKAEMATKEEATKALTDYEKALAH